MSTTLRIRSLGLLAFALLAGGVGCGGSGTNNDQGTSFLAIGYYQDSTGDTGSSGQIVPLFADSASQTPLAVADGNLALTTIGLQNRLTAQFIRLVRIDCAYDVPGSTLAIPDDSFNIGSVLGPAPVGQEQGDEVLGNVRYSEFEIVSPDVMAFLNNNINSVPELPFRMTATCSATGVTQAGDTITSNSLPYQIQFVEFAECCTAGQGGDPGFPVGGGTGGDLSTFGGSDSGTGTTTLGGSLDDEFDPEAFAAEE